MSLRFKQTDSAEVIRYTALDARKQPVNLIGTTVRFLMAKRDAAGVAVNEPAVVTDGMSGKIEYRPSDSAMLQAGVFSAEFHVEWPDGRRKIYPSDGYLQITIAPSLDVNQPGVIEEQIVMRITAIEEFKDEIVAEVDGFRGELVGVEQATNNAGAAANNANQAAGRANNAAELAEGRVVELEGLDVVQLDGRVNEISAQLAHIANLKSYISYEIDGDFSKVIQAAVDSGKPIIEFPNWTKTLKTPVVIPNTVKEIRFNEAVLRYSKEQNAVNPLYTESMFVINGVHDLKVIGGRAEYLGTFNFGDSYSGKISAFHITGSDNFSIEKFEATKFNNCGINISPNEADSYCKNPIIRDCNLHHNRVAGLGFGNTENLLCDNNSMDSNGIETDYSTGYGCTGWKAAYPKNSVITNNKLRNNFRKGIDFHSGFNTTIKNNICDGNRLWGIYVITKNMVGGTVMPTGFIDISDNKILNINKPTTEQREVFGIAIGKSDYGETINYKTIVSINNNTIQEIDDAGTLNPYVFYFVLNGFKNCSITASNNKINVGIVDYIMRVQNDGAVVVENASSNIKFIGNTITAKESQGYAFFISKDSRLKKLDISNNDINITHPYTHLYLCNFADSTPELIFTDPLFTFRGNSLNVNKLNWGDYDPISIFNKPYIFMTDTTFNSVKYRDYNGKSYVGDNIVGVDGEGTNGISYGLNISSGSTATAFKIMDIEAVPKDGVGDVGVYAVLVGNNILTGGKAVVYDLYIDMTSNTITATKRGADGGAVNYSFSTGTIVNGKVPLNITIPAFGSGRCQVIAGSRRHKLYSGK